MKRRIATGIKEYDDLANSHDDLLNNLESIVTAIEAGITAETMLECEDRKNSYLADAKKAIKKAQSV